VILAAGGGPCDMSEELSAISKVSPAPAAQGDYDSICAALMDTERGRWFLQEYARRNRSADTQLLLAAIERIEAVVCAERSKQAQQGFRSDLLEMAKAITRTRAEVAEIRSEPAARSELAMPGSDAAPVPRPPQPRDVFAAAERIRDVTWAMRGHGFDPSTCDQLEELAASILSASSLRDPTDHRASKLSAVLQYLEHRIDTLLESSADGDAAGEPVPEPDREAFATPTNGKAGPENGFASAFVTDEYEQPIKFYGMPVAAHDDDEGSARTSPAPPPEQSLDPAFEPGDPAPAAPEHDNMPPPACDLPTGDADLSRPPSEAGEPAPEPSISAQNHGDGAQTSGDTAPSVQGAVDAEEPTFAGHAEALPLASPDGDMAELAAAAALADEPRAAAPDDLAAPPAEPPAAEPPAAAPPATAPEATGESATTVAAQPRDAFLPTVELPRSSYTLPKSSEVAAAATALREAAARAFLQELQMRADTPGLGAEPAGRVLPTASIPAQAHAATPDLATAVAQELSALGPAAPTSDTAPDQPPSPAPAQPAAAEDVQAPQADGTAGAEPAARHAAPLLAAAPRRPQPPRGDPLAALKAMSDHELIAIFS
jgi:hypothetical protein